MTSLARAFRCWSCILAVVVGTGACSGSESAPSAGPTLGGSRGVTQGGAQDIAQFRDAVARGEVPSPAMLDQQGFFAEHALDLPPADCGEPICMHPFLAVAPRFNGGNWTMAFVALNSAIDPATIERPAVHVAIALEQTERTSPLWASMIQGVRELAGALRAGDRLTLIEYASTAKAPVVDADATVPGVEAALAPSDSSFYSTDAALYDALALAGRSVEAFAGARRVVLLTSGLANAGITSSDRIVSLGEALAQQGIGVSVIGTGGEDYDAGLPSALGEIGAGAYYVAQNGTDLEGIMQSEGATTLVPLVTDFRLEIEASAGYRVGRVYGARRAFVSGATAVLAAPALFLGLRDGASALGSAGRRGGGGGLFVELVADETLASSIGADAPAFSVRASFARTDGTRGLLSESIVNPLVPGQNPGGAWPYLSDPARAKAFMMLNMYLSLRASVDFYEGGDCARAKGVIDMMDRSVELYQAELPDPDIAADADLNQDLRRNLDAACVSVTPVEPIQFTGGCFVS